MPQKSPVRLLEALEAALRSKSRRNNGLLANTDAPSAGAQPKDEKPDERA